MHSLIFKSINVGHLSLIALFFGVLDIPSEFTRSRATLSNGAEIAFRVLFKDFV